MLEENDTARCVAHKKSGERCRRLAIKGATVCRVHGGASGHVRRAARARLEMAADRMAKNLLKMAVDDDVADGVRLAATNSALDRAGLSAKTAVEVEVGPTKGFEQILSAVMQGGTRAESRSRRGDSAEGTDDDPGNADWIAEELAVVDAEVVEEGASSAGSAAPLAPRYDHAEPPQPAGATGFMDLADALEQLHRTAPPPQAPARRNRRSQ